MKRAQIEELREMLDVLQNEDAHDAFNDLAIWMNEHGDEVLERLEETAEE